MYMFFLIVMFLVIIVGFIAIFRNIAPAMKFYIKEFSESKNQKLDEIKYKKRISCMEIPEEFERPYKMLYDKNNKELETKRKKYRKSYIVNVISLSGMLLSFVGVILSLGFLNVVNTVIVHKSIKWCITLIIGFLIFIYVYVKNTNYSTYKKDYIYHFKNNIIGYFIEDIFAEYYYNYGQMKYNNSGDAAVVNKLYSVANFNNEKTENLICTDYIFTNLTSNSRIIIADIKDMPKAFEGIFTYIQTSKKITDRICIVKNKAGFYYNEPKVKLDSHEFEKYFDVYSENQILTIQLLTSDVMQVIENFYNKFNLQFEIIIQDDGVYIRFVSGNLLEAKIFKEAMNKRNLFVYYSVLEFIKDLTISINKAINELNI